MRRTITLLIIMANAAILTAQPTITVKTDQPGIAISPQLWGIFFEDLNWAADGGLYAELVQNRSFEYVNVFGSNFTATSAWSLVQRGGASGAMTVNTQNPLNAVNSHYVTLTVNAAGSGAGLSNAGFAGIPVKNGDTYRFSFFARRSSGSASFTVSLESTSGSTYGTAAISAVTGPWNKYTADISSNATDNNARLVILTTVSGNTDLDVISLFPQKTYKNRENGLRADLVQRIADMKPGFIRFPGGCIVHSNNLATSYRWKTTIGPVEERKNNANRWGYMQTCGLGFYEFFLLCEDLGAKPLPVLPVGVSCHYKTPYEFTPLDSLLPWIEDALNLVEYANGPATSTWGAKRAAAGHPAPFNLEYIGVGNEEWGKEFKDRSDLFISAIRQKYPSIKIVGTVGPSASGSDYDDLWAYNRTKNTDVVDEHYYMDTTWFIHNTHRYDGFARTGPKVFAGEYASRSPLQKKLGNAIAEAAFMTGLERNSDVVQLSCYAPFLRNVNCNGSPAEGPWDPCLVYFDNNRSYVTPSYHVQAMFANNTGHRLLPVAYSASGASEGPLYCVSSKDTVTGDIILKVVNTSASAITATLQLQGAPSLLSTGSMTLLTSPNVNNENSLAQPANVAPVTATLTDVTSSSQRQFPAYSASVLRFATRTVATHGPEKFPASRFADFKVSSRNVLGGSGKVVQVSWTKARSGLVSVKVYDCRGKMVATLIQNAFYGPGTHHLTWAGSSGKPIGQGLFILSATIDGQKVAAVLNQTAF